MPLNHTSSYRIIYISCHWIVLHFIGSDVILSDYILDVTGSDVILLNQASFCRITYFMLLDRTSFYRITYFMSLDRTSFYWIGRHSIRLHTSCHWIGRHFIGSYLILSDCISCHWIRNVIRSDQRLFEKSLFPECYSRYVSLSKYGFSPRRVNIEQHKNNL